jgi:hypothetical protein
VATVLLVGSVANKPRNSNPAGKPPNMNFLLAEPDGRIWRVVALDEAELGVERLVFGDSVAVQGVLDVHAEKGRIAYCIAARQVLFLRGRSITKAAMMHEGQPLNGHYARSPVVERRGPF